MSQEVKHFIFFGKVQGVGFRFTVCNAAKHNRLTGWVRNLPDGTVEMLAKGPKKDIDNCISKIEKYYRTNITHITSNKITNNMPYDGFEITY